MRWLAGLVLLLAACGGPAVPPDVTPETTPTVTTPAPEPVTADPQVKRLPDDQWRAMQQAGVIRAGCPATRADLRRVEVNFHTFGGGVRRGVLVVNRDVAREVAAIFRDIFDAGFPMRSMRPIEQFDGDDNASMAANNTSAYNCRQAGQANSAAADSPHANGRAIDINPVQNPWLDPRCDCFMPTARFAQRTPGRGKILRGGAVWRAFTKRGWIWQDLQTPDFQHFDTGFPSRP